MNSPYRAVIWNKFKRGLDNYLWVGISTYLVLFTLTSFLFTPTISLPIILIRAFGTCAYLLLHIILVIGPLCRLNPLFLPLLYNRRHIGVSCFMTAFVYAVLLVFTYHFGTGMHPIVSVFTSDSGSTLFTAPFQTFGAISLCLLSLLVVTSHDFWLKHLSPPVWKTIHMLIYPAYGFAVAHVVFGILQAEQNIVFFALVLLGALIVSILHFIAGLREVTKGIGVRMNSDDDYVETIAVDDIPEKQGRTVYLHGERVAIFKYDGKVSAISNVCERQNGPLGEGRIIDGLVTCPWHGCQYRPQDGAAPDPHTEKVPTFEVKIIDGKIWINHKPKLPGTYVEPAVIPDYVPLKDEPEDDEFFVGWKKRVPPLQRRFLYNRLIGIFFFAFSLAILIPALQKRYEPSFYNNITKNSFEGILYASPIPHLVVERPGTIPEGMNKMSNYFLVDSQKFGFPSSLAEEMNGKLVSLQGRLIFNRSQTLIEVDKKSIKPISFDTFPQSDSVQEEYLGRYKLTGTIVDSKSFYGARNPGFGKSHRACSVRSIANGIPPLLLVRTESGESMQLIVLDMDGKLLNESILDLVEVPVRITGDAYRWGNKYIFKTEIGLIESLEHI